MIEVLTILSIAVIAFGVWQSKIASKSNRHSARDSTSDSEENPGRSSGVVDRQLAALQRSDVVKKKPINRSAYQLLVQIEQSIKQHAPRSRVLAEVGMGAFMGTRLVDREAFRSFVAKRVDFLVIDGAGNPAFAVEFQGSGHYLGDSAAGRDAVKKTALRMAGIELVEIHDHVSEDERKALIVGALLRNCGGGNSPRKKDQPTALDASVG